MASRESDIIHANILNNKVRRERKREREKAGEYNNKNIIYKTKKRRRKKTTQQPDLKSHEQPQLCGTAPQTRGCFSLFLTYIMQMYMKSKRPRQNPKTAAFFHLYREQKEIGSFLFFSFLISLMCVCVLLLSSGALNRIFYYDYYYFLEERIGERKEDDELPFEGENSFSSFSCCCYAGEASYIEVEVDSSPRNAPLLCCHNKGRAWRCVSTFASDGLAVAARRVQTHTHMGIDY